MLRNPDDDHSLLVFDPKIRGKTDRFDLQVQEAALSAQPGPKTAASRPRAASGLIMRSPPCRRARARRARPAAPRGALGVASFVGALWLNALKMTVIPLVVALLVVGIAKSAEAARGGPHRRAIGAVDRDHLHRLGGVRRAGDPAPDRSCSRCRARPPRACSAALAGVEQARPAPLPGVADFFKGVIPDNVFAAATNGDILPLVVFAVLFALALARISAAGRRAIVGLFEAIADALLVIIGWVLWSRRSACSRSPSRSARPPAARPSPASAIISC